MNSTDMANLIYVGIIPLAAGILAILFNYRIIGKKLGEDYRWDNWHNDYSKFFKLVGPILVAIDLIRITGIYISKLGSLEEIYFLNQTPSDYNKRMNQTGKTMRFFFNAVQVEITLARWLSANVGGKDAISNRLERRISG